MLENVYFRFFSDPAGWCLPVNILSAFLLIKREWHPSQTFTRRPDGRVEIRLETSGRKELIRWVLSWMPDVRVLAPKSLKERIEEKLRDGLERQARTK